MHTKIATRDRIIAFKAHHDDTPLLPETSTEVTTTIRIAVHGWNLTMVGRIKCRNLVKREAIRRDTLKSNTKDTRGSLTLETVANLAQTMDSIAERCTGLPFPTKTLI
jgi:hypothetical protein